MVLFRYQDEFCQTSDLACRDPHVQGFNVVPLVSLSLLKLKSWHIENPRRAARHPAVRLLSKTAYSGTGPGKRALKALETRTPTRQTRGLAKIRIVRKSTIPGATRIPPLE